MTKVGFVGLGKMGQPMALNLARKGHEVAVFDIDAECMQPFTEFNSCRQAENAADAANGAEIAITVLPGPAQIEAVILAEGGMLGSLPEGSVLMDFSTVSPECTDRLANSAHDAGREFADAPIGRLSLHAERGESMFMVGASDAVFARVKPILETMGTSIYHCGGPGTGTRTKLVNNFLAITSCLMNAEAMTLSQAFGLDLAKTMAVISGTTAINGQFQLNYANKVFKGDIEPGFAIDLAHKDLSLVVNAASSSKVPMPVAAIARESLSQARVQGYGDKDFSGLADFWCELAGVAKVRLDQ